MLNQTATIIDGASIQKKKWLGLTTTNYWDGLHRLTERLYPDHTTTSNAYYRLGNTTYPSSTGSTNILDLTATKDRLGNWTYFDYDPLRRLAGVTNANNIIARYGYCTCGVLTSATQRLRQRGAGGHGLYVRHPEPPDADAVPRRLGAQQHIRRPGPGDGGGRFGQQHQQIL